MSEDEEEVEEDMFVTPPETLSGQGFTEVKLCDTGIGICLPNEAKRSLFSHQETR